MVEMPNVQPLPVEPPDAAYDGELDLLLRIAARLGTSSPPVSYSTIAAAFLLANDRVSRWFQGFVTEEARRELLGSGRAADDRSKEAVLRLAQSGELPPPAGDGKFYTISASKRLAEAAELVRSVSRDKALSPRHLLAAYALRIPVDHQDQYKRWELGRLKDDPDFLDFLLSAYPEEADGWRSLFSFGSDEQGRGANKKQSSETVRRAQQQLNELTNARLRVDGVPGPLFAAAVTQFQNRFGLVVDGQLGPKTMQALTGAITIRRAQQQLNELMAAGLYEDGVAGPQTLGAVRRFQDAQGLTADGELGPLTLKALAKALEAQRQSGAETTSTAETAKVSEESTRPPAVATLVRPTYDSDYGYAPGAVDRLNVADEAKAFARLAADAKVEPPLAIGVFGEWGSGKSWFMNKMHEHVQALEKVEGPYLSGIVQIRFNAWHYIETNLWASLVEYIFAELDRWLRDKAADASSPIGTEQVDALFDQLATSRRLKLEAVRDLQTKLKIKRDAEQELQAARADLEQARLRGATASRKEFWRAVWVTLSGLNSVQAKRTKLEGALATLGFRDAATQAKGMYDVLVEAGEQAGRARVIARSSVRLLGSGWWLALAVAIFLLAPPLGEMGLRWFLAQISPKAAAQFSSAMLGFSSWLAGAAGLVAVATKKAAGALDTLQGFGDSLDEAVRKQTEESRTHSAQGEAFAAAEQELARTRAAVETAEQRLVGASAQVDAARQDYEQATARGRLTAFIRDKLADGGYARHLGLVATIRRDFEQLARIMADLARDDGEQERLVQEEARYRQELDALRSELANLVGAAELEALVPAAEVNAAPAGAVRLPPMFRRIILYIDDLDRCPPENVVQVLQAIHLLLCFPLFIVVVAVDARWVSRSLKTQFPDLLQETVITPGTGARGVQGGTTAVADTSAAGRRDPGNDDRERAATSQDYLEKIFQIPYWVRRMEVDSSRDYVRALAKKGAETPHLDIGASHESSAKPPGAGPVSAGPTPLIAQPASGGSDDGQPESHLLAQPAPPQGRQAAAGSGQPPAAEDSPSSSEPKIDLHAEERAAAAMTLARPEIELMAQLAPFLGGTPRRAKRFVNVYRVLKASLEPAEAENCVGNLGVRLVYRALLAQLAIVTGAPVAASRYFDRLDATKADSLSAFIEELKDAGGSFGPETSGESRTVLEALDLLQCWAPQDASSPVDDQALLAELKAQAPRARRYSFTARPH